MSNIKYGLISELDGRTLEKTIDLIISGIATHEIVQVTEIGIFDGGTAKGVHDYLQMKGVFFNYNAIDNEKDKPIIKPFEYCNLIIGNSDEVCNKFPDESQHLIFVDGCHCFAHVVSDFFCYAPKVKKGGYFCFHDTGKHIQPFKDFQHGDEKNPDAYISVRKALETIGLLWEQDSNEFIDRYAEEWQLIFDEADETNPAGGICCFKKLY